MWVGGWLLDLRRPWGCRWTCLLFNGFPVLRSFSLQLAVLLLPWCGWEELFSWLFPSGSTSGRATSAKWCHCHSRVHPRPFPSICHLDDDDTNSKCFKPVETFKQLETIELSYPDSIFHSNVQRDICSSTIRSRPAGHSCRHICRCLYQRCWTASRCVRCNICRWGHLLSQRHRKHPLRRRQSSNHTSGGNCPLLSQPWTWRSQRTWSKRWTATSETFEPA